MDYAFFEALEDDDARAFLASFHAIGADYADDLAQATIAHRTSPLDFSVQSVERLFEAMASDVTTVPAFFDESLPDWIKNSEIYQGGLYEFSEEARPLVLRLSYYLAETLRRASDGALRWSVGDSETAVHNQPVLEGFRNGVQMSPLLVTENLLRRIIEEPDPAVVRDVGPAISTWLKLIGEPS